MSHIRKVEKKGEPENTFSIIKQEIQNEVFQKEKDRADRIANFMQEQFAEAKKNYDIKKAVSLDPLSMQLLRVEMGIKLDIEQPDLKLAQKDASTEAELSRIESKYDKQFDDPSLPKLNFGAIPFLTEKLQTELKEHPVKLPEDVISEICEDAYKKILNLQKTRTKALQSTIQSTIERYGDDKKFESDIQKSKNDLKRAEIDNPKLINQFANIIRDTQASNSKRLRALRGIYSILDQDQEKYFYQLKDIIKMFEVVAEPYKTMAEFYNNKIKRGSNYTYIDPASSLYIALSRDRQAILEAAVIDTVNRLKNLAESKAKVDPTFKIPSPEKLADDVYEAIPALQMDDDAGKSNVVIEITKYIKDKTKLLGFTHPHLNKIDINLLAQLVPPPKKDFVVNDLSSSESKTERKPSLARSTTQRKLQSATPDSKRKTKVAFGEPTDMTPGLTRRPSVDNYNEPNLYKKAFSHTASGNDENDFFDIQTNTTLINPAMQAGKEWREWWLKANPNKEAKIGTQDIMNAAQDHYKLHSDKHAPKQIESDILAAIAEALKKDLKDLSEKDKQDNRSLYVEEARQKYLQEHPQLSRKKSFHSSTTVSLLTSLSDSKRATTAATPKEEPEIKPLTAKERKGTEVKSPLNPKAETKAGPQSDLPDYRERTSRRSPQELPSLVSPTSPTSPTQPQHRRKQKFEKGGLTRVGEDSVMLSPRTVANKILQDPNTPKTEEPNTTLPGAIPEDENTNPRRGPGNSR